MAFFFMETGICLIGQGCNMFLPQWQTPCLVQISEFLSEVLASHVDQRLTAV